MKKYFSANQRRFLSGCILAYTFAYFNRLNLSAALSSIITSLKIAPAEAGLLQTCFSIVYACGQLGIGIFSDHVNPVRFIMLGLSGSVASNFLLGLIGKYTAMIILCFLNGAFQAMLWTPIVHLVCLNFDGEKSQIQAHLWLSFSLAIGHFGAWSISGFAANLFGWRYSFIIPACCTLLCLPVIYRLFRGVVTKNPETAKMKDTHHKCSTVFLLFKRTGFIFVLCTCVLYGFNKDGFVTWTPELLNSVSYGNSFLATSFSLIVPLIEIIGIILGYWLHKHCKRNTRGVITKLLPFMAVFCIPLLFTDSLIVSSVCLGLACSCAYCLNPLLTNLLPIEYTGCGYVGLAAGLSDSFIYLGSALSGFLCGLIYQQNASFGLNIAWITSALLGFVFSFISALPWFSKKVMVQQNK